MGTSLEEVLMDLLTHHARARMQQRGISAATVEALLDFGREVHVDRGCDLVFFDKRTRARLARADRKAAANLNLAQAERICRSYAILGSDGTVITVGHRFRRIPRGR
jgi:hypothetical protein